MAKLKKHCIMCRRDVVFTPKKDGIMRCRCGSEYILEDFECAADADGDEDDAAYVEEAAQSLIDEGLSPYEAWAIVEAENRAE